METKKEYTAPELTVVTFKTERGYAASSNNPLAALNMLANALTGLKGGNMEAWTIDEDETFTESGGFEWS